MSTDKSRLDATFIETQRQALLRLRATLLGAAQSVELDEADVRTQRGAGAVELEDDAQALDALERDGNLVVRDLERLNRVDRALEKIKEGSYGLSDISGEPISRERLQALPEALVTLKEEQLRERTGR